MDSLKVVKALHDMIAELAVPSTQAIGLVTAGWRCQLLRMVYAQGYICVVGADKVRKIPTPLEGVAPLLELLVMVWKMNVIPTVHNCLLFLKLIEALQSVLGASCILENPAAEQLEKRLMNPEGTSPVMPKLTLIPRSVETDDDLELADQDGLGLWARDTVVTDDEP